MARAVDQWTIQTTPAPPLGTETKLTGVSCTAANACTSVGVYKNLEVGGARATLAERWNGSTWAIQTTPAPKESEEASFAGVSCTSATACTAVGQYKTGGFINALAASWNGSTWTMQAPFPFAVESKLEAVSCSASTACTAVGYIKNSSGVFLLLAERWNGKEWVTQAISAPAGAEEPVLNGVVCPSSESCIAVGNYKSGGVYKPLAERWNGVKWEAQTPPSPAGALEAKLAAISCFTTNCQATGQYKNASGTKLTLAERLKTGTWEVLTTPNPTGATEASFKGISCASEFICIGTGSSLNPSASTLAERWIGVFWELMSPLNPTGSEQVLSAISCTSEKSCMAAGSYKKASTVVPLTETYVKVETPVNTAVPTVSPTAPETSQAVTTTNGTWKNEPTSYTYQWKRCNASGLECVNIAGATSSTYYPLAADVEFTLVAQVTASNVAGSASAVSKATEKVKKAGLVTEYALPPGSSPYGIASGPDSNLWLTNGGTNKVGKMTTAGALTEYAVSTEKQQGPISIAAGPDGALWFDSGLNFSNVGRITTAGTLSYFSLSKGMNNGREITTGPDGNLWLASTEGNVGKLTTGGTFTPYASSGEPTGITAGPDGNVWFTQRSGNKIVKSTTAGAMTEYPLTGGATSPYGIVTGPDEKLWFGASGKIGKISTAGAITEYSLPASGEVRGITEGPDGLLWFAHYGADKIGKITTGGTVTEYALPPGSKPWDVVAGSDGNIWFTENGSNRVGMISP